MLNWRRLLFKLHLTRSYPIMLTGIDGSTMPANVIRVNGESADIRPDIRTDGHIQPRPSMIHFDVYTSPKDPNYHLRSAKLDDKVYIANGVDPLVVHDFTGKPRALYMPAPKVEDGTLYPMIKQLKETGKYVPAQSTPVDKHEDFKLGDTDV